VSQKVFDELVCPDCGGKIGAQPGDAHKPCKCFVETKPKSTPAPEPIPLAPVEHPSADAAKKLCRVCGKDLTGKPRLKDEQGYLCKPCADEVDEAEADLIKCPECERRLKSEAFVNYRGTMICRKCNAYHQETDKTKVGKVDLKHYDEFEKKSIKPLLILLGVLAFFMLLSVMRVMGVF
jgi:DNA-directed RNA polymerase subunit RPC12/RpoP